MKTYKESKAEVKKLVETIGLNNILNKHILSLVHAGHDSLNVKNAINYFRFSPRAAKYRQ